MSNPTSNFPTPILANTVKFNFDPEELFWPEVGDATDPEQVLETDGMYKFSKVKKLLGIESIELTKLSRVAQGRGVNTYEEYGFGKPHGSQYVLKMSRFRKTYNLIKKGKDLPTNVNLSVIQPIPKRVKNANQLLKLRGFFRFSAVCRFHPFNEVEVAIKKMTRKEGDQTEAMKNNGCWYDETKREFFVDMKTFGDWFFREIWMR